MNLKNLILFGVFCLVAFAIAKEEEQENGELQQGVLKTL
jgi:hypothetical protein